MPFVSTDDVLEQLRQVMLEKFDLRRKELTNGPEKPPSVRSWETDDWGFPETLDESSLPMGIVDFDERTSDRREQDSGETAELDVTVTVYFSKQGISKSQAKRTAIRYGDGIMWTLMREALVRRPKDSTVLPGLFRVWPKSMRCGITQAQDLMGAEVKAHVIVDSSFTAAVAD